MTEQRRKCICIDMDETFVVSYSFYTGRIVLVKDAAEMIDRFRTLAHSKGYLFVVLSKCPYVVTVCEVACLKPMFDDIVCTAAYRSKVRALDAAGYDTANSWLIDDAIQNVHEFEKCCAGGIRVLDYDLRSAYEELVKRLK
jgi:hypothetical protein